MSAPITRYLTTAEDPLVGAREVESASTKDARETDSCIYEEAMMPLVRILDRVELVLGYRLALLTPNEFAQVSGERVEIVRFRCHTGEIGARKNLKRRRYLIPVTELRKYLTLSNANPLGENNEASQAQD